MSNIAFTKDFSAPGESFAAFNAAVKWCKEQGFSVGRMCAGEPVGIRRGQFDIQKWTNMSAEDKRRLDGQIVPIGDFRDGGARVMLRANPEQVESPPKGD